MDEIEGSSRPLAQCLQVSKTFPGTGTNRIRDAPAAAFSASSRLDGTSGRACGQMIRRAGLNAEHDGISLLGSEIRTRGDRSVKAST